MPAIALGYATPIVLLVLSNVFMTIAWYGHLRFKARPLLLVILASWGIAFFEYLLQAGQPHWPHSAVGCAAQDAARSDHIHGVRAVCAVLFSGAVEAGLSVGGTVHHGRHLLHLSQSEGRRLNQLLPQTCPV